MKTTCSAKDCNDNVRRPNQRYCRACHSAVERRRRAAGLVMIKPGDEFKVRARFIANNAVRNGSLVSPGECERCHKDLPLEKHHHDYSKPLEVEWLCSLCHGAEHSKKPILDEISE